MTNIKTKQNEQKKRKQTMCASWTYHNVFKIQDLARILDKVYYSLIWDNNDDMKKWNNNWNNNNNNNEYTIWYTRCLAILNSVDASRSHEMCFSPRVLWANSVKVERVPLSVFRDYSSEYSCLDRAIETLWKNLFQHRAKCRPFKIHERTKKETGRKKIKHH